MSDFRIHDETSAPDEAKPILEKAKNNFGFVPNLYGVMAESPELLKGYGALSELFQKSSLSGEAKHVVWLAVSAGNECHYCVAAHSGMALQAGLSQEAVEAIRDGKPIPGLARERRLNLEHRGRRPSWRTSPLFVGSN